MSVAGAVMSWVIVSPVVPVLGVAVRAAHGDCVGAVERVVGGIVGEGVSAVLASLNRNARVDREVEFIAVEGEFLAAAVMGGRDALGQGDGVNEPVPW